MATALITGASNGIGLELAKIHASKGGDLVLVARNKAKLDQLKTELESQYKVKVHTIGKDLSAPNAAKEVYDETSKQNMPIDYLINNAGFGDFGDFAQADLDKNLEMIRLNIMALTHLTHAILPLMQKTGKGHIMNVASTAAFMPGPGMAVYYASKAYVLSFSEALSRELKDSGVTISALCPGPTNTGFAKTSGLGNSPMNGFLPAATPARIAIAGYKAMKRGKTIEVPGFMNKLSISLPRFLPRFLIRNLVYGIHRNR